MLRISKLTDYAIIVLGHMAGEPERTYAATDLADSTGVAIPTVSKILKSLTKADILKSTRGAKGGYQLTRSPAKTSVATIIYALEGPIALTECGLDHDQCQQSSSCQIRGHWGVINRAIRTALESVSLADMVMPLTKASEEIHIPVSTLHYQPR
ncbi:SUF system Fe-S cluster assembly regulator [Methylocaldum sp. RMAD-M]|jgi:FeS assembly SUF system regulator|uniref:SUF system Fe-S cluster assembly regulator n=1 Tax=Methylocaldum sp. RMAD-M TaxID=2806557 RepID=UPI000A32872A|nr:SUF system Fe-S cluster assembly regulator [Methylocaldum sp. RMAD-M]MBP1149573.1 FeS assembly SUF system regulator [Methylocaldum sp. RMAD-M]